MSTTHFHGNEVPLVGDLPVVGDKLPSFALVKGDLSEVTNADFEGKRLILNIFPSVDTGVCAQSVRVFNEKASQLDNTVILCISADLPFAQSRFCGAEGINKVETVSSFRSSFGKNMGVLLAGSPLAGLLARAVIVVDESGIVRHVELVEEIAQEPSYDAALAVLG
ncbi:thiol peroxidase [Corynebacterium sp. ES2794-CONJ1]|uniref:thiol peroxidase n=1 Tax=unclassified Corynebacterium TaxID=2624378 RepID=UPI00216751B2|nr:MULTISPECIES: thiol peroxidase [unclassified Corynebacterium]MCS4489236.1 thiol peroxidase [Corynebacterium sp. ES2775-CONJ]MCS4491049.1 thiol peroxidase [Corynebacterium sp. ES2715-CONJ3]MCS4531070.1 thiol peroxidase [Corynebacterium sp. ES2730-CONJ]MCU9518437.1 thiol peroxidase [Corynebacterium sp. ES2794-CONJ1]